MPKSLDEKYSSPQPKKTGKRTDVFISYARTDETIAKNLEILLSMEGFDVWFDSEIYAGAAWEDMLLGKLSRAKAVVVLWSQNSVERPWVLKEAEIAKKAQKLIPVLIDNCTIPESFTSLQTVIIPGWNGSEPHPKLEQLFAGILKLTPASNIAHVRPGFKTDFLGIDIDMPAITGVADEFRYLHFSVIMNPARRLPWYAAYNMEPNVDVIRGDSWQIDPMLSVAFQPNNDHYLSTGFDRGHLAAALSVSWGTPMQAQIANRHSFFWTNTAPQHPQMNRLWWGVVEMWERDLVRKYKKVTGFAGPVFTANDPVHGKLEQKVGRLRLLQNFRLPRCFWKVTLVKGENNQLEAAAFIFDQDALLNGKQLNSNTPASFQSTVQVIESMTGIEFGDNIREARQLELS